MKKSKGKVGVGGIHYYNHFTSFEKGAFRAAAVKKKTKNKKLRQRRKE